MKGLKEQMRRWRLGLEATIPQEYIDLHREAAEKSLPSLCVSHGLRPIATEMVSDGWMDGMTCLRAICEDRLGKLHDMRWSDANGGSWFEKHPSGGAGLVWIPDARPGRL